MPPNVDKVWSGKSLERALGYRALLLSNRSELYFDCRTSVLEALRKRARWEIIVKAIALGATACSTVRSFCYGLTAAGEEGIGHVFALLRSEMLRAQRFIGCRSLNDLGPDRLRRLP